MRSDVVESIVGAKAMLDLFYPAHALLEHALVQSGTREERTPNVQWEGDDTDRHVVTLKGSVTEGAGRDRAVALAKRTGVVRRVVDQLTAIAN